MRTTLTHDNNKIFNLISFSEGDVVEFDFQRKTMQFGPREKLLSPLQVRRTKKLKKIDL